MSAGIAQCAVIDRTVLANKHHGLLRLSGRCHCSGETRRRQKHCGEQRLVPGYYVLHFENFLQPLFV
jgi:hypothetical protein